MKRQLRRLQIWLQERLGLILPRERRIRWLRYYLKEAESRHRHGIRTLAIDPNDLTCRMCAYDMLVYANWCLEKALKLAKTLYF
jgi:hypothetical protein